VVAEIILGAVVVASFAEGVVSRARWDKERRSYIAAAISATTSPSAAAHIIQPKKKADGPSTPRPVQLDL